MATSVDGPALTKACFGDRVAWVPWRRPGFQLAWTSRRSGRPNPTAIGCILGGHGITAWGADSATCTGQLAGDHPDRATVPRRTWASGTVRATAARPPAAADRAAQAARRRTRAVHPGHGVHRPAAGRHVHRRRRGAGFPGRGAASGPRRAGHLVSGPLPAHQGCAAVAGPAADSAAGHGGRPAARAARVLPAGPTAPTTNGTPTRTAHRCAARTRRSLLLPGIGMFGFGRDPADGARGRRVLRQRHQRHARRGVGVPLRPHPRGGTFRHRVLGRWRRPNWPGSRHPGHWRPASRWSPAPGSASARRSRTGWPPRVPAWSSPT